MSKRTTHSWDCPTGGTSTFSLETKVRPYDGVTVIERKGFGHPDTLADHLAEELSRAYSSYTRDRFGAVLHHNFDKLALLGGLSRVRYGGGAVVEPVRVLVNGRATRTCGGDEVPVEELIHDVVDDFMARRLPLLGDSYRIELNVTTNPSPGAVHTDQGRPERTNWFVPESADQLRERRTVLSNDTSMGTGWAPLSDVEIFVRTLADSLSGPGEFTDDRPWCGSDVKVMAVGVDDDVDIVFCVPQVSAHVPNRAAYLANAAEVLEHARSLAAERLADRKVSLRLNARDIVERDEIYLTVTGSSIESGDEGVVGRGNRACGLITPLRPMNLEGVSGKNPVYHVGKLYNLAASRAAQRLQDQYGGYVDVQFVSATGQALAYPWRSVVRMSADVQIDEVAAVLRDVLDSFPTLTDELLAGSVTTA